MKSLGTFFSKLSSAFQILSSVAEYMFLLPHLLSLSLSLSLSHTHTAHFHLSILLYFIHSPPHRANFHSVWICVTDGALRGVEAALTYPERGCGVVSTSPLLRIDAHTKKLHAQVFHSCALTQKEP